MTEGNFVDYVKINVTSGKGGKGSASTVVTADEFWRCEGMWECWSSEKYWFFVDNELRKG